METSRNMLRQVATFVFYGFAVIIVAFGIMREYDLLTFIAPNNIILQIFSLALFSGGMIAWSLVFFLCADGLMQRAISLIAAAVGLLITAAAAVIDTWLRQSLATPPANVGEIAVWVVAGAGAFNMVMVWLFHLGDPRVQRIIRDGIIRDHVIDRAEQIYTDMVENEAATLAREIAARRMNHLRVEIRSDMPFSSRGAENIINPPPHPHEQPERADGKLKNA